MTKILKSAMLALATSSVVLTAVPAEAKHKRGHARYAQNYRSAYAAEPVYANTRVWQGNDGSYYCRKRDGTTGLIVGAAAGVLLGRAVDTHGDRTVGTVLGAAAGALLGKRVEQGSGATCR